MAGADEMLRRLSQDGVPNDLLKLLRGGAAPKRCPQIHPIATMQTGLELTAGR